MSEKDYDLSEFDDLAKEDTDTLAEAEVFASRKQINLIYALFGETGYDKTDFDIPKISKLTNPQAKELIEELIRIKDEHEYEDDLEDHDHDIGEDLPF